MLTGYELVPGLALLALYGVVLLRVRPPLVAPPHHLVVWRLAAVSWWVLMVGGVALLAVVRGWV